MFLLLIDLFFATMCINGTNCEMHCCEYVIAVTYSILSFDFISHSSAK